MNFRKQMNEMKLNKRENVQIVQIIFENKKYSQWTMNIEIMKEVL